LDPILAFSDEASDALLIVDFGWRIVAFKEYALRLAEPLKGDRQRRSWRT